MRIIKKPNENKETEICEKCGSQMIKSGVMESGNAKYFNFICKACNHKKMKCTGVMG